ncbi:MAG TPA: hypothetical protein VMT39_01640 [Candidatus Bathyarchaeia archaeon]|nr:hypothetical protein [Candidatus Bathyarchaeia archaeon]
MNATFATAVMPDVDRDRPHRWRLAAGYILAIALVVAVAVYGFDYYTLDAAHRPLSPKHAALKPSGSIGFKLGIFGLLLFLAIFLYPLRKRWRWLGRQGSSQHWLDFHVLMGLTAPFVIAFHSSFKFHGFAGMAFWIMTAVALSGVIGRYVYGQIPRRVSSAEVSMAELEQQHSVLAQRLAAQKVLPTADLRSLLHLPSAAVVARMPLVVAVGYMIILDLVRPLRVARLRRRALGFGETITTLGGLLRTRHLELELAIDAARDQASLSKRILFLSRAQRVFHLWHVIHRPFSYSFAVLAVIHIAVVTMMGYVWW